MARTRLYPPSVDPGFPELPPTPDGWDHSTFAKVLEVVERPVRLEPEATYRLLTAKRSRGGITLRSELLGREILTKTQFEARAGDFLVSRRQIIHGACGIVPQALDGAVVSNEYSTLRTRPGLLMEFLRQFSHTPYFQRTCFHSSHGVDVEKMIFKIDEWLAREVDVPPLGEQRKIAAILSSVDEAIEATKAVMDQLQVVKKAMMAELLTRGLPGRHSRFKQTEIGAVPEEWELTSLGDISAFVTSGSRGWAQFYSEQGALFIRITNLVRGTTRLDLESRQHVQLPTGSAEGTRTRVEPGDVLVSITADLGIVGLVPLRGFEEAYVNQHIALVRPDRSRADPRYVASVLAGDVGAVQVRRLNDGGAKAGLSLPSVRQLLLPLPPLKEQAALVEPIEDAEDRLHEEQAVFNTLRALKSALMSVLLTGEVRVKPDEDAA